MHRGLKQTKMEIVTIMDFTGKWRIGSDFNVMMNHPGGKPPDVTEGVRAVGGAAGKVCTGDVQGGESGDDDCREYKGGQDHHDDDIGEVDKDINDMELPEFPQGDVQGGEYECCGDDVDGDGDGDNDSGVDGEE